MQVHHARMIEQLRSTPRSLRSLAQEINVNRRTIKRALEGMPLRPSTLTKMSMAIGENAPPSEKMHHLSYQKMHQKVHHSPESAPLVIPENAPESAPLEKVHHFPCPTCTIPRNHSTISAPPLEIIGEKMHHMVLAPFMQICLINIYIKHTHYLVNLINYIKYNHLIINQDNKLKHIFNCDNTKGKVKEGVKGGEKKNLSDFMHNTEIAMDHEPTTAPMTDSPVDERDLPEWARKSSPESTTINSCSDLAHSPIPKKKNRSKSNLAILGDDVTAIIDHLGDLRQRLGLGRPLHNARNRKNILTAMRRDGLTVGDYKAILDYQYASVKDEPHHWKFLSFSTLCRPSAIARIQDWIVAGIGQHSSKKEKKKLKFYDESDRYVLTDGKLTLINGRR